MPAASAVGVAARPHGRPVRSILGGALVGWTVAGFVNALVASADPSLEGGGVVLVLGLLALAALLGGVGAAVGGFA